jgi:hypothetical protein
MEEVINAAIIRIRISIFYPSAHPSFGRGD